MIIKLASKLVSTNGGMPLMKVIKSSYLTNSVDKTISKNKSIIDKILKPVENDSHVLHLLNATETNAKRLVKTANSHCERNKCPKCGGESSCRCRTPKIVQTHNLCWKCREGVK